MTDSVEERIALPVGEIALSRPRDAEALLDQEQFERDEYLPYWAELWSSAVALAHDVAGRSLRGASVLELVERQLDAAEAAAREAGKLE